MTVCDLCALLSTFPPDAPVIAEWEGTWNTITPQGVELSQKPHSGRPLVFLHVDGYALGDDYGKSMPVRDDEELEDAQ